ncbi:nitrite reductase small subunit [Oleiphilus sp. HI0130]|jgi:nitrite reductase (NADH) small subunit|nr:nitrite reductase small subunit [Oleiphilus sp. HI0130]
MKEVDRWIPICEVEDLVDNSGVCALVDEQQVAIFKISTGSESQVFAVSNWDPFGQANVLYRGLVASVNSDNDEQKFVLASPLYKQRYCLATGECLDDQSKMISAYPTRIVGNTVQLGMVG